MDIKKMDSKVELKWRCREHPNVLCDFIYLDGEAKDRVVCNLCVENR